jgi:antitoxin component of RelBE/YafQ-DinJ toxin-antitoxin module
MRVRKVSFTLDDRSLRVYHQTAARLGLTVSSLLRLVATKLESGEFRV